jgi:hypothetical protein
VLTLFAVPHSDPLVPFIRLKRRKQEHAILGAKRRSGFHLILGSKRSRLLASLNSASSGCGLKVWLLTHHVAQTSHIFVSFAKRTKR